MNDSNCNSYIHVEYHMILTLVNAVKYQIPLFSFPCPILLLPTNLAEFLSGIVSSGCTQLGVLYAEQQRNPCIQTTSMCPLVVSVTCCQRLCCLFWHRSLQKLSIDCEFRENQRSDSQQEEGC
jgi:hypothetical protein